MRTREVDHQDNRQHLPRPTMPGGSASDGTLIITGPRVNE